LANADDVVGPRPRLSQRYLDVVRSDALDACGFARPERGAKSFRGLLARQVETAAEFVPERSDPNSQFAGKRPGQVDGGVRNDSYVLRGVLQ